MELQLLTQDQKEQILVDAEVAISQWRAVQLEVLEHLDVAPVATADGCRSLSEWTTARLDFHPDSAKNMVRNAANPSIGPSCEKRWLRAASPSTG